MKLLEILTYPDPRLKQKSQPVDTVTPELQALAKDMLDTMYHYKGIGLAAPQVNRHVRLLVIDTVWHRRPEDDVKNPLTEIEKQYSQPLVMFNPVIKKKDGKETFGEGCLSVPGYYEDVQRAKYVEVEYLDKEGNKQEIKTDGILAVCIQHEIDHLDGFVFVERLSLIKSQRLKAQIKKYGYPNRKKEPSEGHEAL
jgi:peptide deformylase